MFQLLLQLVVYKKLIERLHQLPGCLCRRKQRRQLHQQPLPHHIVKQVKVLFFLGVNDGNIPKGAANGGIISDIDREFLSRSEFELAPTPRAQMYTGRTAESGNRRRPHTAPGGLRCSPTCFRKPPWIPPG